VFKKFPSRLVGQGANPDLLRTRHPDQWESVVLERIKERLPGDPLSGAKVGGKELAARLVDALPTEQVAVTSLPVLRSLRQAAVKTICLATRSISL